MTTRAVRVAELAPAEAYHLDEVDPSRPPFAGDYHSVSGADIYVRTIPSSSPQAPPALYVHGLGGASTNFTDLAALLRPYLDAEALDLPGFGRSGPAVGRDYSIDAHARTVIAHLDQSGRGPVHLVGNSMGGAICIKLAADRPDLVRTLTLISPAVPDLRPRGGADLMLPLLLIPGLGMRAMRRLDTRSPEDRAQALIDLCFADPGRVPANRLPEAAADIRLRRELSWANDAMLASFRGIVRMYLTRGAGSAWNRMRRITAPSLVVWGEFDRLVAVSNAPRVASTIPDATLLRLPDVGHTAQLEAPTTTARAILGLLKRANVEPDSLGVGA